MRIQVTSTPAASRRAIAAAMSGHAGPSALMRAIVRGDGLVDPARHPAHLRQKGAEVNVGLLQADELPGHLRPVRALHQHGQDRRHVGDGARTCGRWWCKCHNWGT
ncbi:hypothetical protein ACFYNW_34260 [Streptomyces virginiae]|uniref:hypothetical protein n=1 Tax=Streptomyces virginiae TaxID=1961 RepID=UPI0036E179D8